MKGKDEVMRSSGVLMHISSLPSPYGIGTMGKEARKFADFLEKSGQKYWQILPICPTRKITASENNIIIPPKNQKS